MLFMDNHKHYQVYKIPVYMYNYKSDYLVESTIQYAEGQLVLCIYMTFMPITANSVGIAQGKLLVAITIATILHILILKVVK